MAKNKAPRTPDLDCEGFVSDKPPVVHHTRDERRALPHIVLAAFAKLRVLETHP